MLDQAQAWLKQPFSESMDLWHWVLLVIVLITVVYLWNDVLRIITE